jgi:hypothetical protein
MAWTSPGVAPKKLEKKAELLAREVNPLHMALFDPVQEPAVKELTSTLEPEPPPENDSVDPVRKGYPTPSAFRSLAALPLIPVAP